MSPKFMMTANMINYKMIGYIGDTYLLTYLLTYYLLTHSLTHSMVQNIV